MSNRKNSGTVKSAAKPVAKSVSKPVVKSVSKPVVKSVHSHSELEQQISELKKELKQAMAVIDRLNSKSIEMSAKIITLSSQKTDNNQDADLSMLINILANYGGAGVQNAIKKQIQKK